MSLQKMLEYQKKDIAFYRQEKDLKESEERKRAVLCKNKFIESNNALQELAKSLKGYFASLQKISARIAEIEAMKEELSANTELKTEESFSDYENRLLDFEKQVNELSKEFSKVTKAISDAAAQNRTLNDRMDALNREYMNSTQAYNKKKADFDAKTKPIRDELEAIAKDIEPTYLNRYLDLRKNKKMPAYVCYMDKNCGACGMDISIEVDKKLQKSGDVAECPHCGRIVYKM